MYPLVKVITGREANRRSLGKHVVCIQGSRGHKVCSPPFSECIQRMQYTVSTIPTKVSPRLTCSSPRKDFDDFGRVHPSSAALASPATDPKSVRHLPLRWVSVGIPRGTVRLLRGEGGKRPRCSDIDILGGGRRRVRLRPSYRPTAHRLTHLSDLPWELPVFRGFSPL